MISRTKLMVGLAGGVFVAACFYVGYANELLKGIISPWNRAALLSGFLLGAGAVSRWIVALDLQRNMKRINRAGDVRRKAR
jgi:uncharacterized membrane protein required for colicin V production